MQGKGFTLIEVIIVIVILGVLATLALPKIVGQLEAARAEEAMNMLGTIKRAAEQCLTMTNDSSTDCITFAQLGITPPGPDALFTYTAEPVGLVPGMIVMAKRKGAGGTSICMSYAPGNNPATQFGASTGSPYTGIVARTGVGNISSAACDAGPVTPM